ncbi:MAG: transcription antitermination factor NusB [Pseudomonadota bacterium]
MAVKTAKPSKIARQTAARLAAVQAVYQQEVSGGTATGLIDQFTSHRFGAEIEGDEYVTPDPGLFAAIVRGVDDRREDVDHMIAGALTTDWSPGRLQAVLRAIMRAGVWELLANSEVDAPIIIADYVHMTDAFFDQKEAALTNAVLDRLNRELRGGD